MSDYKPIETHYNGYRFRSRLEARWAVFFDAAGIEYQYEPEGFEREWEGEKIFYLPDFYLPEFKVYAEVKGSDEALRQDQTKLAAMIDWDGPLADGVIILGEIPNWQKIAWANVPVFSFLKNEKGVYHVLSTFYPLGRKIMFAKGNSMVSMFLHLRDDCCEGINGIPGDTTTKERMFRDELVSHMNVNNKYFVKLKEAYRLAFQARFEHGETPKVKEVNT